MVNVRLQQAFETLMQRAPSALFKRARSLYLSKYSLDGRDTTNQLRLFVSKEHVDEQIVPGGNEGERLAVVTVKPLELTLVHWHQPGPASQDAQKTYFKEEWGLELPTLQPLEGSWFREGGHQSTLVAPAGLRWLRSSTLPINDSPAE